MSAQHTPGEWYAKPTAGNHQYIIASESTGATVALIYDPSNGDAALIAAAPDLLAALRDLLDYAVDRAQFTPENLAAFIDAGSVAIAKAEGR